MRQQPIKVRFLLNMNPKLSQLWSRGALLSVLCAFPSAGESAPLPGQAAFRVGEEWHSLRGATSVRTFEELNQVLQRDASALSRQEMIQSLSQQWRALPLQRLSPRSALELSQLIAAGPTPLDAVEFLDRARVQWPAALNLEIGRGELLYRLGQLSASRRCFEELYESGERAPLLRYLLAVSLWREQPSNRTQLLRARALVDGLIVEGADL